jgi:hypothetical protein
VRTRLLSLLWKEPPLILHIIITAAAISRSQQIVPHEKMHAVQLLQATIE